MEVDSLSDEIERIAREHPMDYHMRHPFPLIRAIEKLRRRDLLAVCAAANPVVVADVGCEWGNISDAIAVTIGSVTRIYCIDLSAHSLDKTMTIADEHGWTSRAVFVQGDAQAIPLGSELVDLCVLSHIMEHLPDPSKGLSEAARLTRHGGTIVVSVPRERSVIVAKRLLAAVGLRRLLGRIPLRTPGHLHPTSAAFVRRLVSAYNAGCVPGERLSVDRVAYSPLRLVGPYVNITIRKGA